MGQLAAPIELTDLWVNYTAREPTRGFISSLITSVLADGGAEGLVGVSREGVEEKHENKL